MNRFWFRPRKYGYGASPTTWEGWAIVAAYIVVLGLLSWWAQGGMNTERLPVFLTIAAALTIGLIWICRKKTDGEWRMRWGDRHKRD